MSFECDIPIGDIVTFGDIVSIFQCGSGGGMLHSKKTNTLVIVANYTKRLYENRWFDDVLHYTGMGKNGDQSLAFRQNKTLAKSNENGVGIHLFEVFIPTEYIYKGQVHLSSAPYQETQSGKNSIDRQVWMFPLKLKAIDKTLLEKNKEAIHNKIRKLSTDELKKRAQQNGRDKAGRRTVTSLAYIRDEAVSEYAKRRANGICQLCGEQAPFDDEHGNPYLESHHIEWLSKDGPDTIDNTVALCPNCHRKMHVKNLPSDKTILLKTVINK